LTKSYEEKTLVKYRIEINQDNCIACMACYSLDTTHFEPDKNNEKSKVVGGKTLDKLSFGIFEDNEIDTVQEAVDSCPVSVISIEEI
jgi:ferredoxin